MKQIIRSYFLQAVLTTSAFFLSISLYQHWSLKYSGGTARGFCDAKGVIGCDSVSISPWAEPFFGIPIAALALAFFLVVLILEFTPKFKPKTFPLYLWMGLGSIAYVGVMVFSVRQICPLCIVTHICIWIAIGLKFLESPKVWNDITVWRLGVIIPLLIGFSIQHWGLPFFIQKKNWSLSSIREDDFQPVASPNIPQSSPTILLGHGSKKIDMIVATDFMCLHCREHFFELSRALHAANISANIVLLLDPLDETCNPPAGNLHPGSCQATRVGICQFKRGSFDSFFHNIYLEPGRALGGAQTLLATESKNENDKKELEVCVQSEETEQILKDHLAVVFNSNVSGTPTTWVGGYKFEGQLGWKEWDEIFRRIKL